MANYKLTNDYWETSGVYDITQGKTQREINADLKTSADSVIKPETASGSIATFEGTEGVPLKNLTVNIEPVQSGSGDPSPDNVRPITGWTGANVTRTGKNVSPTDTIPEYSYSNFYTISTLTQAKALSYFTILPAGTYCLSRGSDGYVKPWFKVWELDGTPITTTGKGFSGSWARPANSGNNFLNYEEYRWKPVYDDNDAFIKFTLTKTLGLLIVHKNGAGNLTKAQIELGTQPTEYEARSLSKYSITFPLSAGTVYGGTLDVTNGVLTVDRWYTTFDNTSIIGLPQLDSEKALSNRFDCPIYGATVKNAPNNGFLRTNLFQTSWQPMGHNDTVTPYKCSVYGNKLYFTMPKGMDNTAVRQFLLDNNAEVVCQLSTPVTYTLTPTEVKTLFGLNNIWADCGDVDVQYGAYLTVVENQLGERIPKVAVAPIEKTTTASKAYSVNEMFFMGDKLYIATASIASGATFTVGTNCDETTIGEILTTLLNA